MSFDAYISIALGAAGTCLGIYGLALTISSGEAVLRGGCKITRRRNQLIYWVNFAAICLLVVIGIGMIYFATVVG